LNIDWNAIEQEIANSKPAKLWSDEAIEIIKHCYGKVSHPKTAEIINSQLGTNYTSKQVSCKCSHLGLSTDK